MIMILFGALSAGTKTYLLCWSDRHAFTSAFDEEAEKWLMRHPLYQIYLPQPKYIPIRNASLSLHAKPNDIHQADIPYLRHDKYKKENT